MKARALLIAAWRAETNLTNGIDEVKGGREHHTPASEILLDNDLDPSMYQTLSESGENSRFDKHSFRLGKITLNIIS